MSPIERNTIRIEGKSIIADGYGEDSGKLFEYFGSDWDLSLRELQTIGETKEIHGVRIIFGPDVLNATERTSWKNQNGISYSKRRGLGFHPQFRTGIWIEVDYVKNR